MRLDLGQIHVQLLSKRQDYLGDMSNPSTGKNASAAVYGGRYGTKGRNFRIDAKRPAKIGRLAEEPDSLGKNLGYTIHFYQRRIFEY